MRAFQLFLLAGLTFGNAAPASAYTYPAHAAKCGYQGDVQVDFTVKKDGSIAGAEIHTSSGYPDLDAEAIQRASGWHYEPETDAKGRPVDAIMSARIIFRMDPAERTLFSPDATCTLPPSP